MWFRPLLLSAALPAAALAQAFEYAAGTSRYTITQTSKVTQEMMGQKNSGETSVNQTLTVTLNRASRDTVSGLLVLDSISTSNTMGVPAPSLAHLVGLKVTTRMSPGGTVYSVDGPKEEDVPQASQLTLGMGQFLPKIRGKLAKGSTWTDTTSGIVKQFGIDLNRRVISSYTVLGDTTAAGEPAWRVSRQDSTTLSGSGVGQSGAMTMEGSSGASSVFVVTNGGAFVGASGTEDGSVRVVLSANGMEISVTTSSTSKVQRVK